MPRRTKAGIIGAVYSGVGVVVWTFLLAIDRVVLLRVGYSGNRVVGFCQS